MKNILVSFTSILLLSLGSCSKETPEPDSQPETAIVQFSETAIIFKENDTKKEIQLTLSEALSKDTPVKVEVIATGDKPIITNPAITDNKISLLIPKGNRSVTFEVTPVDNDQINTSKEVIFKLSTLPEGITQGIKKELKLVITDDESPVQVNFESNQMVVDEKDNEKTIKIQLSGKSPGAGMIELKFESDMANYGYHFTTIPQATNGKILLGVDPGTESVSFKLIPVNNNELEGKLDLTFNIDSTYGAIKRGELTALKVSITDDEMEGLSKGYTTTGGGWKVQRFFGYNEEGNVTKIIWRQYTPNLTSGYTTYQYNSNGTLQGSQSSDLTETKYLYDNNRIVKKEVYKENVLKEYVLYGYDQAGNIGEAKYFHRQKNGEMKEGFTFVYLYFTNRNLYKQLTYHPNQNGEPQLISTKTYDNYLEKDNPFPIEIIPNISSQPKLPRTHIVEENGKTQSFDFTYEFDNTGKLTKRTATGGETSVYHYY